jgi:nicotinamidase-related amidase
MRAALLLIDIQNDYFPGGKNELVGSLNASLVAKGMLEAFREKKLPVIHIQHISTRTGATYFVQNTPGVRFNENVMPLPNEIVIIKHFPNSFRNTELLDVLKKAGVGKLIICGMMTHMCIDSTTRAAFDLGFDCTVVQEACATKDMPVDNKIIPADVVHQAFLGALNGTFAKVTSAEKALSEL